MSDNLDSFFQRERENLQPEEPDAGHDERFAARLLAEPSGKNIPVAWVKWAIAASVLLFIGIAGWVTSIPKDGSGLALVSDTVTTLAEVSPEYADVEVYYQHLVTTRMEEAGQLTRESEKEWTSLQAALKDLETHYERLQVDLSQQPDNALIINSMIQNYRLRVRILDQLINELENALPKKNYNEVPQV